jgi:hypothetical protein
MLCAEYSGRTLDAHARTASKPHSRTLATQLLDAVISPMLTRALIGKNLNDVRGDIRSHVKQTIAFFAAPMHWTLSCKRRGADALSCAPHFFKRFDRK